LFEVWDINAASLDLFLAAQSQWRIISVGMTGALVWLGLDYQGVDVLMRRRGASDKDEQLFADLLVMEGAALDAFGDIER